MFFFIRVDGGGFSFFDFQNHEVGGKNVNENHDEAYPANNYSTETVSSYCKQCRGLLAMNVRLLEKIRSF